MLTGGGTGGHITPLLAVAHKLHVAAPETELLYIGERGGKFRHLVKDSPYLSRTYFIFAGKFRRYHGESLLRRLLDVKTNLYNLRDVLLAVLGCVEAFILLIRVKPDVIFVKGGFVGVPVGLAARLLKIPYITHDSDTMPGLANRIIGGSARWNATGMPAEFYRYPAHKVRFVGVPLTETFKFVTPELQAVYLRELGRSESDEVLFITGSSQGAQTLNDLVAQIMPDLLADRPHLFVIHQTGKGAAYGTFRHERLFCERFSKDLYRKTGAAHLIVARAGMTTIAELAVQAKPAIIVPSPFLSGGHQLKNAAELERTGAALVLQEAALQQNPSLLLNAVIKLLEDRNEAKHIAANLHHMSRSDAAEQLATLILETAQQKT